MLVGHTGTSVRYWAYARPSLAARRRNVDLILDIGCAEDRQVEELAFPGRAGL